MTKMSEAEKRFVKALTIREFKEEIDLLNLDNVTFNVRSQGDGNIFLSTDNCKISVYMEDEDGICSQIIISKPDVKVTIEIDAIQDIIKEDDKRYCLDMDSSMFMSDIDITVVK